ncbi:dockerin type I domain-containing protein, partial [Ruminococcus flavefaciens]|uniref:dockerin type I domain-containing protein n=1 Tax=Ruminococcus flavefaciens TaxID=1265 RepID=UPI0026ECC44A
PINYTNYYYERTHEFLERQKIDNTLKKYVTGENTLGDVDNSGAVNAIDASLVLDYYSKASTGQSTSLDDTQKKAADVDKNGNINAIDASMILSYYVYTSTANGESESFETFINR